MNITNSDEFVKKPQQQRDQRYIHEHFDQFYKGLKVEGGGYNFHFRDGKMYLAHGNYVKINGLNINPSISAEKAADLFADYKSIPRDSVNGFLNELSIKEIPSTAKEDAKTDSKLVYQIRILAADVHNDETGYVKGENEIPL